MIRLNQTLSTPDPAKLLESEEGVFEVISPGGDVLIYVCERGHSITSQQFTKNDPNLASNFWRVTKIGEQSTHTPSYAGKPTGA